MHLLTTRFGYSRYICLGLLTSSILSTVSLKRMFHIVILVFFILNQVHLYNARDCSPVACPKVPCNITRKVPLDQGTILWNRNKQFAFFSNHPCTSASTNGNYSGYCFDDSTDRTYVLEILHPEFHDQSNFTDNIISVTTTMEVMEPDNFSSDNVTINTTDTITGDILHVSVRVPCNKPQPTFTWNFNASTTTIPYTIEGTQTSTDNTGCTSSLLNRLSLLNFNLNDWDPEITKINGDIDISVEVKFGDCIFSSPPVTVKYIAPGSPSSPPTPSASTSLQPTSSAQNPSTKVSSESSTSTTPTPKCEDLICVCDQICIIIIICVCVGSLIIIVVIILCCCCCPFCPCYKRKKKKREGTECKCCGLICLCCKDHEEESEGRAKVCESCCCLFCVCYKPKKKKREGTECKCCGLICVCCRPNNKDHDEESEGRAKVCESCCCLFCVCYKRKKKSGDRNSNPNKKKSASRSQQYEMPRTNHPDGMHSYSGYQVNRPDERARVNQPADMNYNVSRPDQPARVYQPADMNYHVLRPDQQARVYQPSPATGFTPNDSRYGQGYNNAAYIHHGENERRRNVDRKLHVTQRPYTKHY